MSSMKREINSDVETLQEVTTNNLNKVTPLSKYLAMILFILMPFIGGWIGYQYAPEKVVEVEKVIVKESAQETPQSGEGVSNDENAIAKININIQPHSIIKPYGPDGGTERQSDKDYTFKNNAYSVSFRAPESVIIHDRYTDARETKTDLHYSAAFYKQNYDTDEHDEVVNWLFTYSAYTNDYCPANFCNKEVEGNVSILSEKWEHLGSYQRSDAGFTNSIGYIYRKIDGNYVQYITSDIQLHDVEVTDVYMKQILSTLKFEALK